MDIFQCVTSQNQFFGFRPEAFGSGGLSSAARMAFCQLPTIFTRSPSGPGVVFGTFLGRPIFAISMLQGSHIGIHQEKNTHAKSFHVSFCQSWAPPSKSKPGLCSP